MEFLKKHYEKILLSVVLLGLIGVAWWLLKVIDKARNETPGDAPLSVSAAPLKPIDLTNEMAAVQAITNPPRLVLSAEHNVFNPMTWKLSADGKKLNKISVEGAQALIITGIDPLYTVISYDRAAGATSGNMYYFGIQPPVGRKTTDSAKVGEKSRSGKFTLTEVKGAPEAPDELVLQMTDTQQKVSVTRDKPYQQIDSYVVDLSYPPENKTLKRKRVNDMITLDKENYKIVAIGNKDARIKSISTEKQITILWNDAATPKSGTAPSGTAAPNSAPTQ